MAALLEVRALAKRFAGRTGRDQPLWVIKDLSFAVGDGEFLTIIGPSGAGKTTLLNMIAQIDVANGGEVRFQSEVAPIADPKAGPLIAVKLHIITRKSLGGIETDLSGRALAVSGEPIPGLYAAGEASGFGGGGVHGYRALEGTFLGGCIFSGRAAGRAMAAAV